MHRNQIAKGWSQLVTLVTSVKRTSARSDAFAHEVSPPSGTSDGYIETRPMPYSPENHRERGESSLHMSC